MAVTRYYFPRTGTPVASPAFSSHWDIVTSADRLPLLNTGNGGDASNLLTSRSETSTSIVNRLIRQYVYGTPLAAQTISGTFTLCMQGNESNSGANSFMDCVIRIFSGDGSTELAVLYSGQTAVTPDADPAADTGEFSTSVQTRVMSDIPLTPFVVPAGSLLVIDTGFRTTNVSGTTLDGSLRYGAVNAQSDLAETPGSTTDGRPWIEFDLVDPPGTPTGLAIDPTATTADFDWSASSGSPTGYEIRLNGGAATDVGNVLTHNFTGLTPATTYNSPGAEVRAYNAGGYSAWASISFTTDAGSVVTDAVVEIAFDSGYSTPAASRTWTDVTDYVMILQGIDITYGRSDEQGQADANTMRLVLKNSDGRFTPHLSTSPYYPDVKIGRPIRVTTTTTAGFSSTRFLGYIDDWTLEWPATVDTFATAAVSATSRIARMGASAPLGNHIYEAIKQDNPSAYFMLDSLADSVAGGISLAQAGTGTAVTFEGTGPTDGIQAAQFAGGKVLQNSAVLDPNGSAWVSCFFVRTTAAGTLLELVRAGDSTASISVALDSDGFGGTRVQASAQAAGGPVVTAVSTETTSQSFSDGEVHHALALVTGGVVSVYVDGVLTGDTADASLSPFTAALPAGMRVGGDPLGGIFTGTIAHAAFGASSITSTRILAHATAGLTGHAGETAQARLERYAAWAGIPTAEYSFSTDADTPMAHIDTTGQTVLALMQRVAETDGGVLYDSKAGVLTYAARTARYTATAAVTLAANASQVEASYAPKLDRSALINEVVATVADGSDPQETITAKNQTSYDEYGPHRVEIELATTDANQAHAAAWWRVGTYGEPRARAPQVGVEIAHLSTALQAQILALKVGDKITITNLPSQSDASTKSFFIEGYTERIEAVTHRFEFNISPTTGFDVWILGDATYSVLGSTTRLAY